MQNLHHQLDHVNVFTTHVHTHTRASCLGYTFLAKTILGLLVGRSTTAFAVLDGLLLGFVGSGCGTASLAGGSSYNLLVTACNFLSNALSTAGTVCLGLGLGTRSGLSLLAFVVLAFNNCRHCQGHCSKGR